MKPFLNIGARCYHKAAVAFNWGGGPSSKHSFPALRFNSEATLRRSFPGRLALRLFWAFS
jgi:hypothetical protein